MDPKIDPSPYTYTPDEDLDPMLDLALLQGAIEALVTNARDLNSTPIFDGYEAAMALAVTGHLDEAEAAAGGGAVGGGHGERGGGSGNVRSRPNAARRVQVPGPDAPGTFARHPSDRCAASSPWRACLMSLEKWVLASWML